MTKFEFSELNRGHVVQWREDDEIGLVCYVTTDDEPDSNQPFEVVAARRVWIRWESGASDGYTEIDAYKMRRLS